MKEYRKASPWSKDNFELTSSFAKLFELTVNNIQNQLSFLPFNEKVLRLVLLASAKGGLPERSFLTELINRIADENLVVESSRLGGYIEFNYQLHSGNSGFFRWFIEPHTLAAIYMLVKTPRKGQLRSMNDRKLLSIINAQTRNLNDVKPFSSLSQFCKAACFFAMESSNISLPSYLISFIKKEVNSTSINRQSLNNLWPETDSSTTTFSFPLKNNLKKEKSLDSGPSNSANKTFLRLLRDALRVKDDNQKLVRQEETLAKLEELSKYEHSFARLLLLEYITFGIRVKRWRTSSANTYLSHIATTWLFETHQFSSDDMSQEQVTNLFERLIKSAEGNISRADKASIIHSFFEFNHDYFGIPLPLPKEKKFIKVYNVRNSFVSEHNFAKFLGVLKSNSDHSSLIVQGLMLCAMLMARCGLRVNELNKLRVADVEPSNEYSIFITENDYGKNKTDSALRKLPISVLLPPHEFVLFKQYFKKRVHDVGKKRNTVLFSQSSNTNIPFCHGILHKAISIPLSLLCGESVSCHTLRHKAISTLQVVLCSKRLQNITPYDKHQIEIIRRFFGYYSGRDVLYEIAAFSGHLDPSITLKTYMHFTDIILFEHLTRYQVKMGKGYWTNLAGISKHLMTRRISAECPSNDEIEYILVELLCGKSKANRLGYTSDTVLPKIQYPSKEVSFEDCLSTLKLFEKEKSLVQVIDLLGIDGNRISLWLENATKLTTLCTSKGKPRLFPNCSGGRLAPIPPSSKVEYQKAQSVIHMARMFYKKSKPDLIWFIQFVVSHAMNSHSYMIIHEPETLKKFMSIALEMTIPEDWKIKFDAPKFDRTSASKKYKNAAPDINFQYTRNIIESKMFPSGRVYLYFLMPRDPSKKPSDSRRSSNIIKFVCHILAIMVPNAIPDT